MLTAEPLISTLGYLRCDAFDLNEGERVLSLREQTIAPAAMKMLASLLKNNKTCTELDLTASDIEKEGASALAAVLPFNTTLQTLRLRCAFAHSLSHIAHHYHHPPLTPLLLSSLPRSYNPALDPASIAALRAAVAEHPSFKTLECN